MSDENARGGVMSGLPVTPRRTRHRDHAIDNIVHDLADVLNPDRLDVLYEKLREEIEIREQDAYDDGLSLAEATESDAAKDRFLDRLNATMQRCFSRVAPVRDRCTDWRRCPQEPWRSISDELNRERP